MSISGKRKETLARVFFGLLAAVFLGLMARELSTGTLHFARFDGSGRGHHGGVTGHESVRSTGGKALGVLAFAPFPIYILLVALRPSLLGRPGPILWVAGAAVLGAIGLSAGSCG